MHSPPSSNPLCHTSYPSLLGLPGPLTDPVLGVARGRPLRPQNQTQPGQLQTVPVQVHVGVPAQVVQDPRPALVQRDLGSQHGVEAEVDIRGQQVIQQGVDPLCVRGAAYEVANFGPPAGGGGGAPLNGVVATRAQGQNTLEGLPGPQQSALVNSERTRVVQDDSSVLQPQMYGTFFISSLLLLFFKLSSVVSFTSEPLQKVFQTSVYMCDSAEP